MRVSTVFLAASALGLAAPLITGWGGHDGGVRALLAYAVFPWCAGLGLLASIVYLALSRSVQSWVELVVAAALSALAARMFL